MEHKLEEDLHLQKLFLVIQDSIQSNEKWLYYFWKVPQIRNYLTQHEETFWRYDAVLRVKSILNDKNFQITVDIFLNDGTEHILNQVMQLSDFEQEVERNIQKSHKDFLEEKIREKSIQIEFYKEKVSLLEQDIRDLEKEIDKLK